jgi:C1A family cysteine protease
MREHLKKMIYLWAVLGTVGAGLLVNGMTAKATETDASRQSLIRLPVEVHDYRDTSDTGLRVYSGTESKYDARDVNGVSKVTSVKNQEEYGLCWSFSSMAAIECNLIKKGYADTSLDLSENHLGYFMYNRQADSLGNTKGDATYISGSWYSMGAPLWSAGFTLETWSGATTEEKSPLISIPNGSLCYAHDYSVTDTYFYQYDTDNLDYTVNQIKQAVKEHGAVVVGLTWADGCSVTKVNGQNVSIYNRKYYNPDTAAYYFNGTTSTATMGHAVTIVGWDDNYSTSNFASVKPSKNGAWIIKNSYGTEYGDEGYNYLSYEDKGIDYLMAFEAVPESMQYDNNYQYDGSANCVSGIACSSGTSVANVFQAKASKTGVEELKAVGICTYSTDTSYQIQVYTGLTSASKPTSGTPAFSSTVKGTLTDMGYQTIELPSSVALVPGEWFSVVVTLSGPNGKAAYLGVDANYSDSGVYFVSSVGANQSFVYTSNQWVDVYGFKNSYNLRIKAYTDNTDTKATLKLSSSSMGVSKGSSSKLSLITNPTNIFRTVTWKSSNKKVATVSSKGVVKGKAYGSATISATFVKAGSKTTLKCKVTVGPSKIKKYKVKAGKGKVTVSWKKNSAAKGYVIYYSKKKDSGYKKLTTAKAGKTSVSKKLKSGTYYVKMRAYRLSGKKKLYGSYTAAKKVTVK